MESLLSEMVKSCDSEDFIATTLEIQPKESSEMEEESFLGILCICGQTGSRSSLDDHVLEYIWHRLDNEFQRPPQEQVSWHLAQNNSTPKIGPITQKSSASVPT